MMVSSLVAYAAVALPTHAVRAPFIEKIEVTVTTGDDDLREDSSARVSLLFANSHRQSVGLDKVGETIGGGQKKTLTFIPTRPDLTVADLHRVRVDFNSGKATGFDDHWRLQGVMVKVTAGGRDTIVYNRQDLGMHLKYSQHWSSTFFTGANVTDEVNPSEIYAEIEGGEGPADRDQVLLDIETDDGLSWHGSRPGRDFNASSYGGARVESTVNQKIAIQSIRVLRIGYKAQGNGAWTMRGIRFMYKNAHGDTIEFGSFNEANVRFDMGGWWQSPILRKAKRPTGQPITFLKIEVLTGADDLRRLELPAGQPQAYNSRLDITLNAPIVAGYHYPAWMVEGDYVRNLLSRTQPMILQDQDEFPQGWNAPFLSYSRNSKTHRAKGRPFFVSSDLLNVQVKFKQGIGGDLSNLISQGAAAALRQPDNWDMQGIIISTPDTSVGYRRLYSNFAINKRFTRNDETWKSPNFETMLLRRI